MGTNYTLNYLIIILITMLVFKIIFNIMDRFDINFLKIFRKTNKKSSAGGT
jgi:hypothetical protein